jgi:hypothetical protein
MRRGSCWQDTSTHMSRLLYPVTEINPSEANTIGLSAILKVSRVSFVLWSSNQAIISPGISQAKAIAQSCKAFSTLCQSHGRRGCDLMLDKAGIDIVSQKLLGLLLSIDKYFFQRWKSSVGGLLNVI